MVDKKILVAFILFFLIIAIALFFSGTGFQIVQIGGEVQNVDIYPDQLVQFQPIDNSATCTTSDFSVCENVLSNILGTSVDYVKNHYDLTCINNLCYGRPRQ